MANLSSEYFHNEEKAYAYLETVVWPDGPTCPHCGECEKIGALKPFTPRRKVKKGGEYVFDAKGEHVWRESPKRYGVKKCYSCRKQFTATVGTVFESSKIPLNKWLMATHLMTSSKKGMSAHQIHRSLDITYKTAWFMCHRIREAMADDNPPPLGGKDKVIEADETYYGNKVGLKKKRAMQRQGVKGFGGSSNKYTVVSLVERGGNVRSFHIDTATKSNIREILVRNADRESILSTDESNLYTESGPEFKRHYRVNHSAGEYKRVHLQADAYTNTLEGYYSIFKRGMIGTYQHCSEAHLQRYVTEFDFRYNGRKLNDNERRDKALAGISGKRLTYRRTKDAA